MGDLEFLNEPQYFCSLEWDDAENVVRFTWEETVPIPDGQGGIDLGVTDFGTHAVRCGLYPTRRLALGALFAEILKTEDFQIWHYAAFLIKNSPYFKQ